MGAPGGGFAVVMHVSRVGVGEGHDVGLPHVLDSCWTLLRKIYFCFEYYSNECRPTSTYTLSAQRILQLLM